MGGKFQHHVRFSEQDLIAFGVGNDGNHPAAGEREQVLLHARRKAVVAKLDQQVVRAANRVALGMGKRIPNIVVREVEVATQAERQFPIAGIVELPQHFGVTVAIVGELVIAVRRGDDVRNPVFRGDAAHLSRHLP